MTARSDSHTKNLLNHNAPIEVMPTSSTNLSIS